MWRFFLTSVFSMFGALTIGNIVGPQVYLTREAPVYKTGIFVDMLVLNW